MSLFSLTCLIPFFNERNRCIQVLNTLSTIKEIDQFVCVDDGSIDDSATQIADTFPQVKIVRLSKNSGKSAAVALGLQHVTTTHTLLFDADLHDFSPQEIRAGIQKVFQNPEIDLLIFQQKNDPYLLRCLGMDVLVSGERIAATKELQRASRLATRAYHIELAINEYFLSNKGKIATTPLHAQNYLKSQKWPWQIALKKSLQLQKLFFTRQYWQQYRELRYG